MHTIWSYKGRKLRIAMRILLIEEDFLFGSGMKDHLSNHDYTVDWLDNHKHSANIVFTKEHFDLCIIDIDIPGWDWPKWMVAFNKKPISTPIIAFTRNLEQVESSGVQFNAVLLKQFSNPVDLLNKVHNILQFSSQINNNELKFQGIKLNLNTRKAVVDGKEIKLSTREYAILRILLKNPGQIIPKERILHSIYGWDTHVNGNVLDVHVYNLRRKLKTNYIETVYGVGYAIKNGSGKLGEKF